MNKKLVEKNIERYFLEFAPMNYYREPNRATRHSCGYDFYISEDITIQPHSTALIDTNTMAHMNKDEMLSLSLRSGLSFKKTLFLCNPPGRIDMDYWMKDQIRFILHNYGDKPIQLKQGERIGQGVFQKYLITKEDSFDEGNERIGGFGSTGK